MKLTADNEAINCLKDYFNKDFIEITVDGEKKIFVSEEKLKEKNKIIDLMLEYISNITDCPFEKEGKYLDCERMCDVRTDKECWKQYFENKAKEK